jgi:hypothetical protein
VPEWTSNDGWILMSLFLVHRETGAELCEIIGAADATNHAIPTAEELSQSLTRFAKCGLLSFDGRRYVIAPEFLPSIEKAYDGRGGLFSSGEKGLKWLRRSKLTDCAEGRIELSEADVEGAYQQYVATFPK